MFHCNMTISQLFKCGRCVNIGNNKNKDDCHQCCVISKYNLLLYKKILLLPWLVKWVSLEQDTHCSDYQSFLFDAQFN